MQQQFLLLLVLGTAAVVRAWNPDAGLVQPLGGVARTVSVTSNQAGAGPILDGNDNTAWQSDACLPTGFIGRLELNPVLQACTTAARCTATTGSTDLNSAVDGSFYTGAAIKAVSSKATITIKLASPGPVYQVYYKGIWGATTKVNLITTSGATIAVSTATSAVNYQDQVVKGSWANIASVQVTSSAGFTLTEVALQGGRCFEQASLDMKAVYSVSMIRARWWSTDSVNTSLLISQNGVSWTVVRPDLVPNALPAQELWFDTAPLTARYIAIRHMVNEASNWRKVYVWELAAYPAGGRWGPPPPALPQSRSYRQLMGINGIWGWGSGTFSDTAVAAGKGPLLYNAVAASGRNYQNMNWDVRQPGNDPKYDTMSTTGTDGQWWLDWDREYRPWNSSGLPVDVSYQFGAVDQPPASWPDAYSTSYDLGFKFARHFGPTAGTGTVVSFEAGNEPWDYNATFYSQLLRGFIDGAYTGDPAIKRLPCALQADDLLSESASGGNYIGARLPVDLAPKIDALNLHIYSFWNNATGSRLGVHPEHPGSSMNGLHNMLSWRDTNMPGVPVWVTEWGWDAYRPGETCGSATECVSQLAQAAYGIRGLALLARKGVAHSHWFFYANDNGCQTLFCRSGLRDTAANNFADLPVYRAFLALMQLAGNATFQAAPVESSLLHVHVLKAAGAPSPTHVLLWRPLAVGDVEPAPVTLSFTVGFAAGPAKAAWRLNGAVPNGRVAAALPIISGTQWTMAVSAVPTLVGLA